MSNGCRIVKSKLNLEAILLMKVINRRGFSSAQIRVNGCEGAKMEWMLTWVHSVHAA